MSRIFILFLSIFFTTNALASRGLSPIPLSAVELDTDGNFVECILVDGRSLVATTGLVILNSRILSKSMPRAFVGHKTQALEYVGWQFRVRVVKQVAGIGHKAGVQVQYLDSTIKPVGTVENVLCR